VIPDSTAQYMTSRGFDVPDKYTTQGRPGFWKKMFCFHKWEYFEHMNKVTTVNNQGFFHTGPGYVCSKCNTEQR